MRNIIALILSLILVFSLGACAVKEEFDPGDPVEEPQNTEIDGQENPEEPEEKEYVTALFKIVDGAETGNLVLAGETGGEVYTLNANNHPVYLDGKPANASVLEDGMTAEIVWNGEILEIYPASFGGEIRSISVYSLGTEKNPGGTYYDLAGLYIQAVKDIWEPDSGLNGGAEILSICFENAPKELTEGEKAAITWVLANDLGFKGEALNLSYEELIAEGYLAPYDDEGKSYWFENGILITVSVDEQDETIFGLRTLQFDVTKWRSPLGAYMFFDCKATWPQMGTWEEYTVGAHAIS